MFPDLSDEIAEAFLKRLQTFAILIRNVPERFSYPRDEADEPYINLAIEVSARFPGDSRQGLA